MHSGHFHVRCNEPPGRVLIHVIVAFNYDLALK